MGGALHRYDQAAVTAAGASALAFFCAHPFDTSYFSSCVSERVGWREASASRQNLQYSLA